MPNFPTWPPPYGPTSFPTTYGHSSSTMHGRSMLKKAVAYDTISVLAAASPTQLMLHQPNVRFEVPAGEYRFFCRRQGQAGDANCAEAFVTAATTSLKEANRLAASQSATVTGFEVVATGNVRNNAVLSMRLLQTTVDCGSAQPPGSMQLLIASHAQFEAVLTIPGGTYVDDARDLIRVMLFLEYQAAWDLG